MTIIFPSGNVADEKDIKNVQEEIKQILKKGLPEETQTAEVIRHILRDLSEKIDEMKLIL